MLTSHNSNRAHCPTPKNFQDIVQVALALAARGLPVFPCTADKNPTCPHGFKDATCDAVGIHALWRHHPGLLIGVPTGSASGIFVVDVDNAKHVTAAEWLERQAPYLPETQQHRTRSGGLHLLFKHRDALRNSASRLARGVDTRGEGGYLIWWPAAIPNGHHSAPLADVPEWMVAGLSPPEPRYPAPPTRRPLTTEFALNKIEGIVGTIAAAHEGERNSLLHWGACRLAELVDQSILARSDAFALAIEAARQAGLPDPEARRTVQSAFRGAS